VLYEITAAEDVEIRGKAEERQLNKESRNVQSKRFDPSKSDLQIHLEGMRAEFAAARLLGASLNWELLTGGDKNKGDLTLSDGRTASVKFRKKRGWDFALQSANPDEFKEDIGILVYPSDKHFRALDIFGWISREDFIKNSKIRDYKYGDRLIVGPAGMNPTASLIEQLRLTQAKRT
jgi:hypothetical protein